MCWRLWATIDRNQLKYYHIYPYPEISYENMKLLDKFSAEDIFPSLVSGRGYKISPVCLCVCLLVSALTAEPFDIRTQNLVEALTLIISRMSFEVKVIGQRSRSPG